MTPSVTVTPTTAPVVVVQKSNGEITSPPQVVVQAPTKQNETLSSLEQQKNLKSFVDNEISSKVKGIVKEQVIKLFSDFIQKQEELDRKQEEEFEKREMDLVKKGLQDQMAAQQSQMTQMMLAAQQQRQ